MPVLPARLALVADHLAALADADPAGLGGHRGHPVLGWSQDEIVTGLPGPHAMLSLAVAKPAEVRPRRLAVRVGDHRQPQRSHLIRPGRSGQTGPAAPARPA
ncbi:hypothetical protein [Actinokineospora fastidiosa]|uniref:Uncharacterized protein n=1 Tax=Actinokineospora fastidiosa TaxID=1816 RepID=A0A918GNE0_9PSEU|nr:hypothetical protein [Actinokineospora fastidiosa]GGS49130.1 hypothetical protein GCM10010171_50290 [Actinokineospora fastidiosa]